MGRKSKTIETMIIYVDRLTEKVYLEYFENNDGTSPLDEVIIPKQEIPVFDDMLIYDKTLCYNSTDKFYPKYTINKNKEWSAIEDINQKCNRDILQGYIWNNHNVWLSFENQMNFKAEFDLACKGLVTYPTVFKFTDIFYEFNNLEELTNFYVGAHNWIKQCLHVCWLEKEALYLTEDKPNAINQ